MLSVNEVNQIMDRRESTRTKVYEKILKRCNNRILAAAKSNDNFCLFMVPEFELGLPLYKLDTCIKFLIYSLRKGGFKVEYYYPNLLHIKWNQKNENKPLIEYTANIPLAPRPIATGKTADHFRAINDYVPTGSFLR